jgi:predicted  nucleic acid-binding Zn-ribbon protein
MLQNGGGKGVLLTGITCTTIPHRHNDLETLRNFVVSMTQPSHVVLEWADARTGRLLVTAQILAPDYDGKLHRRFYSFHPSAALDADRLPFHRDGHWLPFEDYCTELRDLQKRIEALELRIEEGQERWEKHQRGLGLQPDLFDVQRRMNAKESDAAAAFTTTSADAFVDWLLRKATDEDQYTDFGAAFRSYAVAHDESARWERERQFALEMRQACDDVARFHDTLLHHAEAADNAERELVHLTAALRARQSALAATAAEDSAKVNAAHRTHEDAKRSRELAEQRLHHVWRHTYSLELDSIAQQQQDVNKHKEEVQVHTSAWQVVLLALRHTQALDTHDRAQQALIQAERTAEPYVRALDAAAAALRAGYARAESNVRDTIRTLEEASTSARREIDKWRGHSEELLTTAGAAREETRSLQGMIRSFASRLETARAKELLTPQENAADAAARSRGQAQHSQQLLQEAKQTRNSVRAERDRAHKAAANKRQRAWSNRQTATAAGDEIDRLRARAVPVLHNPLSAELLEAQPDELAARDALQWLHDHATTLYQLAQRRVGGLETTRTRKHVELQQDQDLLLLLDTSEGLLPAAKDVRDLCAELSAQGVHAVPGWQWMRDNIPTAERQRVISTHPDLVGGIIVGGSDGLETARRHLQNLRPLPAAAVAVGTGERMLNPHAADGDGRFVVEPTPALHDEEAAAHERTEVEARISAVTRELQALDERIAAAQELVRLLANWRDACGELSVPTRLEQWEELQKIAAEAEADLAAAQAEAGEQDAALENAEDACERLAEQTQAIERTVDALAQLAEQEAAADQAQSRITTLTTESQARQRELDSLRGKIQQAEDEILGRARAIEAAEQQAHGYAQAREEITATAEAQQAHDVLDTERDPLPVLQHRYRQARDELQGVQVGEDQQQRAAKAQQALRDIQEEWGKVPAHVQGMAMEFSRDARAGDEVQRHAIVRELSTQTDSCEQRLQQLRDQASRLTERITHLPPADPRSGEDAAAWTPTTLDEAGSLTVQATNEYDTAQEHERGATERFNSARRNQTDSNRELAAFDRIQPMLEQAVHGLAVPAVQAPYEGTAEAAESAARRVTATHTTSRDAARQAERRVETGVGRLKEAAVDVRFEGLDIPLRTQISALDGRLIPAMAAAWTDALQSRIAALTTDLEGMGKTRDALASQASGHVTDLLQRLDQASRFSAFPDGDTPWAGQKFLTIRYKKPDMAALAAQMRETVDALARNPRTRKLKGIDIVMRCLKDAVPRGFAAEVMKPNASRRLDRVPVEEMSRVFSGGQELTGAILLYCALAALRTSPGPRSRTRNGGLLLLDNPIGRANAGYLVDLQMEMAAALGIQLIYTTGLSDEDVTSRFPMRIQLRNDAEARSGLSLIRLEDRVRTALIPAPRITPDQDAPEPAGLLTSARLFRKQDHAQ